MLTLILIGNSFQFNGRNYLQIHGTAVGTKMAVALANIFMADIETQIVSQSVVKPTVRKRYIDDIFLGNTAQADVIQAMEKCIDAVRKWIIQDRLMINDDKNEFLLVDTRQQLDKLDSCSITVHGQQSYQSKPMC